MYDTKNYTLKKDGPITGFPTFITFTVGNKGDKAVLIQHHHDPSAPNMFLGSFNIVVDGVETAVYSNIWQNPVFAAKVWSALLTPSEKILEDKNWVVVQN